MSLRRRYLDTVQTLLFRNRTKQPWNGNAVACSKPPALETCSDIIWYFISFNAEYLRYKGACHDSQTDPLDAPLSVSVLPANKLSMQELHQLIGIELITSCFLENLGS